MLFSKRAVWSIFVFLVAAGLIIGASAADGLSGAIDLGDIASNLTDNFTDNNSSINNYSDYRLDGFSPSEVFVYYENSTVCTDVCHTIFIR